MICFVLVILLYCLLAVAVAIAAHLNNLWISQKPQRSCYSLSSAIEAKINLKIFNTNRIRWLIYRKCFFIRFRFQSKANTSFIMHAQLIREIWWSDIWWLGLHEWGKLINRWWMKLSKCIVSPSCVFSLGITEIKAADHLLRLFPSK